MDGHDVKPINNTACFLSDLEVFELLMILRFGIFEDNNHCVISRKYIDKFSNIVLIKNDF